MKEGRMTRAVQSRIARGMQITSQIALASLICAGSGLISPANAQTLSSSYTSTASKDCRIIGKPSELDELARKAADETAHGFKCGKDAVKVIGASGRAVELATRR
jgi:hypothetical protein